jgi:DNA-binding response OmpR family regulator
MNSEEKNGQSILIIDDDAFLLDMYALKFTQHGFKVETSTGTMEALEKLQAGSNPKIILVDIVMPAMDGFEFLAKIREENIASDATKIVLSNLGQQEDIDKGISLGASGYIVKASATPSEVVAKVEEMISRKK